MNTFLNISCNNIFMVKYRIKNPGIGIDIEDIGRFKDLDINKENVFLRNVFTKNELDYCFSKKEPARHLAVRFAAKEAIIKAINFLSKKKPALNEIEIINNINGVPLVNLGGYDVKVSLSHCKDKAIAFAILEKN